MLCVHAYVVDIGVIQRLVVNNFVGYMVILSRIYSQDSNIRNRKPTMRKVREI